MNTDMLSAIEEGMKDLILGMSEGDYYFTWRCVNEPDNARRTFPSADIDIESEENVDEEDGAWSRAYENRATYNITVRARLPEEVGSGYQVYEANMELNRALSDLKKLFGENYTVGTDTCATIMYKGFVRETELSGDLLLPKRMVTQWLVRYTQSRSNPDVVRNG